MTDLVRNEALFDKIAAQIEETPDRYNQGAYSSETVCGTAHCVAGWACVLSGIAPISMGAMTWFKATCLLGLKMMDDETEIFGANWMEGRPVAEVADALRAIGRGAPVKDYL